MSDYSSMARERERERERKNLRLFAGMVVVKRAQGRCGRAAVELSVLFVAVLPLYCVALVL